MQRRIHENSLANLKRFQSGQSGNPGGRRAGDSLTALLNRVLDESAKGKANKGLSNSEVIVRALIEAASQRDVKAIREILDRIDGPVKQKVEIEQVAHGVREQALVHFAAVSQLSANIHAKYCGSDQGCVCLSREQIIDSILGGFPERHREMAVRAIEEEFPELLTG